MITITQKKKLQTVDLLRAKNHGKKLQTVDLLRAKNHGERGVAFRYSDYVYMIISDYFFLDKGRTGKDIPVYCLDTGFICCIPSDTLVTEVNLDVQVTE